MSKADDKEPSKHQKETALTVAAVQKLIDAAFVRFEMRHGHLSAADGEAVLKTLED